jgi:hypothetical protein
MLQVLVVQFSLLADTQQHFFEPFCAPHQEKKKFPGHCLSFQLKVKKMQKKNRKIFPHPEIFNVLPRGHVSSKNSKKKKLI